MTDTTITETHVTQKKHRKVAKKRAAAPAAAKPPADSVYVGLSVLDCCTKCNVNGCVISGKSYCAHPRKGGLHAAEQQDDAALRRRRDAERFIGKQKLVVE
jgi:hypothetical protein